MRNAIARWWHKHILGHYVQDIQNGAVAAHSICYGCDPKGRDKVWEWE